MSDNGSVDVKLAKLDGKFDLLSQKVEMVQLSIDNLTQGLGQRVEDHGQKIAVIRNDIDTIKTNSNHLYGKLDKHIRTHWQFIGLAIGTLTLISVMLKLLKLF